MAIAPPRRKSVPVIRRRRRVEKPARVATEGSEAELNK